MGLCLRKEGMRSRLQTSSADHLCWAVVCGLYVSYRPTAAGRGLERSAAGVLQVKDTTSLQSLSLDRLGDWDECRQVSVQGLREMGRHESTRHGVGN